MYPSDLTVSRFHPHHQQHQQQQHHRRQPKLPAEGVPSPLVQSRRGLRWKAGGRWFRKSSTDINQTTQTLKRTKSETRDYIERSFVLQNDAILSSCPSLMFMGTKDELVLAHVARNPSANKCHQVLGLLKTTHPESAPSARNRLPNAATVFRTVIF